jgi:hypothetical protein
MMRPKYLLPFVGKRRSDRIRTIREIVAVLALGMLSAGLFMTCNINSMPGYIDETDRTGNPSTPSTGSGTGGGDSETPEPPINGEVSFPGGGEGGAITFAITWEGSADSGAGGDRSVAGTTMGDIKASPARGVRNVYQLIAVDDTAPDAVWRFDPVRNGVGDLNVEIVRGHTYHFLFLGGHVPDRDAPVGAGNVPTLLASGYLNARMSTETSANTLSLTMVPLVADTAFVRNGASTGSATGSELRQVGRLAKTVGWTPLPATRSA